MKTTANYTPREVYLRKQRKEKITVKAWQIGVLVALIALWELLTAVGVVDSFFLSSPSGIVKCFISLLGGEIWMHVGITLLECVLGFTLSTVIGLIIAVLLWWSERARAVCEPYLVVANALPKIALGPIIIIWVGAGMQAIIAMAFLICIVTTTISLLNGFCACDECMILLMRSMGASKLQILTKLVFPSSLPTLISVIKINVGLAWVGTIMGEYLVSGAGLGYLIIYGGQVFAIDLVMTATVLLCLLAAIMYLIVAIVEKKVNKKIN